MKVTVSFPGLGIGETTLNPVAFTLFGKIEVRWYGLFITFAMLLAFLYVCRRAKKSEGISSENVIDVGLVTIIIAIIGARLYYVLTSLENYHSLGEALAIWTGGLGIYGGILGGALGIWLVCRIKKINSLRFFDATVPAVMFGQVLGRWGNFFNGEAYGYQITDAGTTRFFFFLKEFSLPAGKGTLFHWLRMGLSPNDFSYGLAYVHPTFLYEGIWNFCGFILLNLLYRKKKFHGQILLSYLAWYGFGRMWIEGLRSDSLYIFKGIFGTAGIRISQLIGLLCFLVGTALLILIPVWRKRHPAPAENAPLLADGAPAQDVPPSPSGEEPVPESASGEESVSEPPEAEEPPKQPDAEEQPAKPPKQPPARKTATPRSSRPKSVKIMPKASQKEDDEHATS